MNNTEKKDNDENKANEETEDIYKKLNAFKPLSLRPKKHPCKDCYNCLYCNEMRCQVCMRNKETK